MPNISLFLIDFLQNSFIVIIKSIWPIFVFIFIWFLAKLAIKLYQLNKFKQANMFEIDKMNGTEFERYLELLFQKQGYKVIRVGSPEDDYGADLIITKDSLTTAIQAKRHNSLIGVDAVREVHGSIKMYNCKKGMVVTNSYFTDQAKILAKANDIELWDRKMLANKISTK